MSNCSCRSFQIGWKSLKETANECRDQTKKKKLKNTKFKNKVLKNGHGQKQLAHTSGR